MFIGIPDFSIFAAYFLCITSALACVVYGLYNWNNGGESGIQQIEEEVQ